MSRVAVLDLRARADVFLGDGGLARLADRLERAGHAVARIDRTLPGEPAERDAFLASLERDIGARGLEAIILARAWDGAILEALRRGLAGGKLLRLSSGVAAALDDRFDAVLDEQGVRAVLDGEAVPAPAPRPRNAREARALKVLDRDEGPESAGSRPAIRGPSIGCPYLVDAARQAPFAGLELDRDKVQTKGCTFCLDNTGTYAASSEEETIARWLAQLRALRIDRAEQPLEVLLIDERPHPFLPRLFREIAADPSLGSIELLIKSRVDWLFEFEAAIAEACREAEPSGSKVHIYLVGFESFDPATLALFNKGSSAEDNVRAIALLRDLARRFPRAFEHERLRAHGFVAFTPWTTPESLLINARAMRAVGFERLRSEAARTRLRLYPRTPLYALAEADGLLVEGFGARGDRAAEQGYDASFAWRFADPRLEAIFHAAEGLRRYSRDVPDPDLLELATRFVLRWPAFAAAPELAHLALVQAARSWHVPPADLGASLGGAGAIDLELERIAACEKRALLKEAVPEADAEALARAYRAIGFASAVVEGHGIDATGGAHTEGKGHAIVAVARTEEDLEEAIRLQRARDVRAMGAWMGYPACCVEAFLAQPDRRDNVENERWTLRRTAEAPLDARLARLGRVRLVSHHPCRADCAPSIAIAERALERVRAVSPEDAARIEASLARATLFLDHARAALLDGRWDGERFVLEAIEPVRWGEGGEAYAGAVAIELEVDRAVLIARGGERRVIAADRPLIVVPGEPLAPAVRRLLRSTPAPRPIAAAVPLGSPPPSSAVRGSPPAAPGLNALPALRLLGSPPPAPRPANLAAPELLESTHPMPHPLASSARPQSPGSAPGPIAAAQRTASAPRWLELTPDYRCNQRCVGCGAVDAGGPSLSARDLLAAIIDGRRQGIKQLWIGGGEPTLRRDLLPLVREARARGYTRVRLQTNAAMLAYPEVATKLAQAGVTDIAVSIKGPDAASHDRLARAEGSFDLLCRGIASARAIGLPIEGDVLAYRSTARRIPEIVGSFFARGVARFRIWMMAPDPRDSEALAEEPRWSEVARGVEEALLLGLADDDPEHVISLHTPPCTLDDRAARARFFAPELGLLVHDASGHRFALESSELEGGSFPAACEGCALRSRCNGVRAPYVARHGDRELTPRKLA